MDFWLPAIVAAATLVAATAMGFIRKPLLELRPNASGVWRDSGTYILLLSILLSIAWCFWINVGDHGKKSEALITNLTFLICGAAGTLLVFRAACNMRLDPAVQRG